MRVMTGITGLKNCCGLGIGREVGGGTGEVPGVGRAGIRVREEEDLEEHCRLSRDQGELCKGPAVSGWVILPGLGPYLSPGQNGLRLR